MSPERCEHYAGGCAVDTDGDGFFDFQEERWGTDPEVSTSAECWALVQEHGPWEPFPTGGAKEYPEARIPSGNYDGIDFRGCGNFLGTYSSASTVLSDYSFVGANLSGAVIYLPLYTNIDFTNADLSYITVLDSEIYTAFRNVDFTGADLTGAIFPTFDHTVDAAGTVVIPTTKLSGITYGARETGWILHNPGLPLDIRGARFEFVVLTGDWSNVIMDDDTIFATIEPPGGGPCPGTIEPPGGLPVEGGVAVDSEGICPAPSNP